MTRPPASWVFLKIVLKVVMFGFGMSLAKLTHATFRPLANWQTDCGPLLPPAARRSPFRVRPRDRRCPFAEPPLPGLPATPCPPVAVPPAPVVPPVATTPPVPGLPRAVPPPVGLPPDPACRPSMLPPVALPPVAVPPSAAARCAAAPWLPPVALLPPVACPPSLLEDPQPASARVQPNRIDVAEPAFTGASKARREETGTTYAHIGALSGPIGRAPPLTFEENAAAARRVTKMLVSALVAGPDRPPAGTARSGSSAGSAPPACWSGGPGDARRPRWRRP